MAASSQDKDYAHRLVARIAAAQGGKTPELIVHAKGGGTLAGKLEDAAQLSALRADLIIVQMGENEKEATDAVFVRPYDALLKLLRDANPAARILCTGVWAPPQGNRTKDDLIRTLCHKHRLAFVDLAAANRDRLNQAGATGRWEHAGVSWHPSDAGMEAYAEAIWETLRRGDAAIPQLPAKPKSTTESVLLFQEKFSQADTTVLAQWRPPLGLLVESELGNVLELKSDDAAKIIVIRRSLPVEKFRGRSVRVEATIRASGVTLPPKPWNGVKLMLDIADAEGGHDYPQASVSTVPELSWQTIGFNRVIPDNTVGLHLAVGLERVAGTLWVEEVRISTLP